MLIFCGRRVSINGKPGVWVVIRKHAGGMVEVEREHNPPRRMSVHREALLPPRR